MAYLIGTDEAGYGPNLGPLVVSMVAWEVPDDWLSHDSIDDCIADRLQSWIASPREASLRCSGKPEPSAMDSRVVWGDSKELYAAGRGIELLERGVLTALAAEHDVPVSWREIWGRLKAASNAELDDEPWFVGYNRELCDEQTLAGIRTEGMRLRNGLRELGVRIASVQARAVFPRCFNEQIEQLGNKASALSHTTLALVKSAVSLNHARPCLISCDKHGGRDRYAALLQTFFPESWIQIVKEGRDVSRYWFGERKERVEFRFIAKGESFLPSALASMVSKYLRELAMEAFNAFWCRQVPELRPTAGYPVDAARFRAEVQSRRSHLGISDHVFWRCR